MPKRKTLASLEKQIALTKHQLLKAKARYEKLAGILHESFFPATHPVNPSQEGLFVCCGVFKSVTAEAYRSFPRPF